MVRIYASGDKGQVREKVAFWVHPNAKPPRGKRKKGNSTPRKQEANQRAAVRRLARIINCNFFYSRGDVWLTLDYARLPETWEQAVHDCKLFRGRVARWLKKQGRQLEAVWVTSDLNGDTGEAARMHHHLVMCNVPLEVLRQLWPHGTVDYKTVVNQDDQTKLAAYIIRQAKKQPDAKKYGCTRNLKGPVVVDEYYIDPTEELKAPSKAVIQEATINTDDDRAVHYIRYIEQPRRPRKIGGGTGGQVRSGKAVPGQGRGRGKST